MSLTSAPRNTGFVTPAGGASSKGDGPVRMPMVQTLFCAPSVSAKAHITMARRSVEEAATLYISASIILPGLGAPDKKFTILRSARPIHRMYDSLSPTAGRHLNESAS